MALVDYEKMRNKEISTKSIELNPHLKKKIENAKSQIKQMDVSQELLINYFAHLDLKL